MDDLKYLVPLVTFILGLLATPFVEELKLKFKIRQLKLDVSAELNDEFSGLKKAIVTVDKSIKTRENQSAKFLYIGLAAPIDFLILEKHLIEIYRHLTQSQRVAYKRILDLNRQIHEKRDLVLDKFNDDNWECLGLEKAMLYELLSLYYIIQNLINSKDSFIFPTKGNDEVVKDAALALKVKFPY